MNPLTRVVASSCVVLAIATAGAPSRAQSSQAEAQRMFEEGKRQLAAGHYETAIETFRRVAATYPSVGAHFNIGDAYERSNKYVAAWAAYGEAERLAHAKLDPREADAAAKMRALEPRLPKLIVRDASPDLFVTIKDPLPREEWNRPLRRAPGSYELVARARCKLTATIRITIGDDAHDDIVLPRLEDDPACRGEGPSPPANTQRLLGWTTVGAGAIGVGVGAVFGLMTISTKSDLDRACRGDYASCVSDDRRVTDDLNATAHRQATISTIGLVAGGALIVTGIVLVVTSRKGDAPALVGRF